MYKTLLIEDELEVSTLLQTLIKNYTSDLSIIGVATSVNQAIEIINAQQPDLLLLDVELDDGTGFDLLDHFKKPSFVTVFITAYSRYSIEAIKHRTADFILKPIVVKDLVEGIERAKEQIKEKRILAKVYKLNQKVADRKITFLLKNERSIICDFNDIVYLKSDQGYTRVFLSETKPALLKKTLKDYESILPKQFYRIHNSYIVNKHYIKSFLLERTGKVTMKDGTILPISARKKQEFLQWVQ